MKALIAKRPDDDEIARWWVQTQQVLYERHQWAHSLLVRDDPSPSNGRKLRWLLVQTKDGFERPLPSGDDAEQLLARMTELCATGYSIAERLRRERELSAMAWDERGLRLAGFVGFVPLLTLDLGGVPDEPGVYCVVRPESSKPEFLERSVAGWWKDKDPSVSGEVLTKAWVDGTAVIYIGKASTSLRRRLRPYRRHGEGRKAAHWGGRYVWQLADHAELLICWRPETEDPDAIESELIESFRVRFGLRPFANLRK